MGADMNELLPTRIKQVIVPVFTFLIIQLVVTLVFAYGAGEGWLPEAEMSAVASMAAALINCFVLFVLDRRLSIGALNRESVLEKINCMDLTKKIIGVALVLLIAVFTNLFFNGIVMLIGIPKFDPLYQRTAETFVSGSFMLQIIAFGFVVPVAEELLFRGIVYNVIKTRFSIRASVLMTALIFAVYHGNLTQGVYAFGIGIMLCLICESGGLLFSILLHVGVNLVSLIGNHIDLYTSTLEHAANRWYVIAAAGLLMIGFYKVLRNLNDVSGRPDHHKTA